MDSKEQPTCGKGLAENAVLPATLSHLITSMANNLHVHMNALDVTDPNSQQEYDAYEKLVGHLRQVAAELQWAANEMIGSRDLPMGRHDEAAMTQPAVREAFEQLVAHKRELYVLLQETSEPDRQLLEVMRAHIP